MRDAITARMARPAGRSRSTATPGWPTATSPERPGLPFAVLRGSAGTDLPDAHARRVHGAVPVHRRGPDGRRRAEPRRHDRARTARRPRGKRAAVGHLRRAEGGRARGPSRRWSRSRRSSTSWRPSPGEVVLPRFVVTAVAEVPGGAAPSYAHGYYDRDNAAYRDWERISRDRETFAAWLDELREGRGRGGEPGELRFTRRRDDDRRRGPRAARRPGGVRRDRPPVPRGQPRPPPSRTGPGADLRVRDDRHPARRAAAVDRRRRAGRDRRCRW